MAQKGTRSERVIPKLSRSNVTLEHIARLSEPYGTKIEIRDGVGYVHLN